MTRTGTRADSAHLAQDHVRIAGARKVQLEDVPQQPAEIIIPTSKTLLFRL
jgi:hypothetical protein